MTVFFMVSLGATYTHEAIGSRVCVTSSERQGTRAPASRKVRSTIYGPRLSKVVATYERSRGGYSKNEGGNRGRRGPLGGACSPNLPIHSRVKALAQFEFVDLDGRHIDRHMYAFDSFSFFLLFSRQLRLSR